MSASRNESKRPPPEPAPPSAPESDGLQRLWAPWRMRYVAGGHRDAGCIFCNRLAENDDVRTLILHRGERAFVIMNLFPYNTGHVMLVPNSHVASPEDADPEMLAEMAALRGPVLRALRRALAPEGFNLGLNVGAVAGAGVSDHLHEHVVPRWGGDANFMPILAATTVMPELIPVTYAKLRAELERELLAATSISSLVLSPDRELALADVSGKLPRIAASEGEPLWRAALRDIHDLGAIEAELTGWAGALHAGSGEPVLLFRAAFPAVTTPSPVARLVRVADLLPALDEGGLAALSRFSAEETA
jgi:ATP adenylyltransferase